MLCGCVLVGPDEAEACAVAWSLCCKALLSHVSGRLVEGSSSVKGGALGTDSVHNVSCDAEDCTEGRCSRRDSLKRKCVLSTKR